MMQILIDSEVGTVGHKKIIQNCPKLETIELSY